MGILGKGNGLGRKIVITAEQVHYSTCRAAIFVQKNGGGIWVAEHIQPGDQAI